VSDDLSRWPNDGSDSGKLDDGLAEDVRAAAADAGGPSLSEWVRSVLKHQNALHEQVAELHPSRHTAVSEQICELIGN